MSLWPESDPRDVEIARLRAELAEALTLLEVLMKVGPVPGPIRDGAIELIERRRKAAGIGET
jgi:hypothetical protein